MTKQPAGCCFVLGASITPPIKAPFRPKLRYFFHFFLITRFYGGMLQRARRRGRTLLPFRLRRGGTKEKASFSPLPPGERGFAHRLLLGAQHHFRFGPDSRQLLNLRGRQTCSPFAPFGRPIEAVPGF